MINLNQNCTGGKAVGADEQRIVKLFAENKSTARIENTADMRSCHADAQAFS